MPHLYPASTGGGGGGGTPDDNSVTTAKIVNGAVTGPKVNDALKPSVSAAAGTEALRALGTSSSTAAAGDDSRLTDTRTPTDNTVSTAKLVDGAVTGPKVADALKPSVSAAAGTESLRALGTTASTAAAGNDSRLSDTRTPTDNSVTSAKIVDATIVAGDLADLAVSARKATDLLRTGGWVPTSAIDQTVPDRIAVTTTLTPVSGTLYLAGGVVLPGGRTVSSISFMSTGTASAPSNQWYCLVDQSRNVLATTVDDLTTAWSGNTVKTLLLATTLGGATPGGTYTPTNAIEVYVGICQVATTPSTVKAASTNVSLSGIAPIQCGSSSTGLTTPASLGSTAGAITATNTLLYGWVS